MLRALSAGRVAPGLDLAGEVIARCLAVTAFDVGGRVVCLLGRAGGRDSVRDPAGTLRITFAVVTYPP